MVIMEMKERLDLVSDVRRDSLFKEIASNIGSGGQE